MITPAFAVNYSDAAADLLRRGVIAPDRFKCPAWPDLLAEVRRQHPCYVHFPLVVGSGNGDARNAEQGQPADWAAIERMLRETDTPLVNLHLNATMRDHSGIAQHRTDADAIAQVTEAYLRDVLPVVARWGAEHVIVENTPAESGRLRAAYLPAVIRHVVEETGCGLLLDVSHARIAAADLGMDARDYLAALPLPRTREIHLTGIQTFDGYWTDYLRAAGLDDAFFARYVGRPLDHLPFTDADWAFTEWAMAQVHSGAWGAPWIVSLEYGGVGGGFFGAVTNAEVIATQVPRLQAMVQPT